MNFPSVLVLAAVAVLAGLAVFYLIVQRKKGNSGCGDCNGCSAYGTCNKKREI